MTTTIDLSKIAHLRLKNGVGDGQKTACIMSATAILAGLEFNDHPTCTSPLIARLMIHVNDGPYWANDEERTAVRDSLIELVLRLVAMKDEPATTEASA